MLEFASARNEIVRSRDAMRDCIERCRDDLGGDAIDLLVFHTTIGHDFRELIDEARSAAPQMELVGCTSCGVVGNDGASERMRALAVMAIKGDKEFAVAHADAVRGANSYDVAASVARDLRQQSSAINMINILASGIDIAGDEAIAGIESVFGPEVPIFGGTSADNMKARATYQFVGDQILERGLLLVGYADPSLRLTTAVHHGSIPIGKPFEVTRAEGNRIFELDGEPAWPRLMDVLGIDVDADVSETIPVSGLGQQIPQELRAEYDNDHFVHTIFKVDAERSSFYTPASVPAGTRLWLMRRDEDLIFEGVDKMVARLKERLSGSQMVAMFHTDCAARGRLMFNQILKDEIITRMQYPLCEGEQIPWLGCYGFGEFTPVAGVNRFHTQTSSLYAVARER